MLVRTALDTELVIPDTAPLIPARVDPDRLVRRVIERFIVRPCNALPVLRRVIEGFQRLPDRDLQLLGRLIRAAPVPFCSVDDPIDLVKVTKSPTRGIARVDVGSPVDRSASRGLIGTVVMFQRVGQREHVR